MTLGHYAEFTLVYQERSTEQRRLTILWWYANMPKKAMSMFQASWHSMDEVYVQQWTSTS